MIFLKLFLNFITVGLFSFGGAYSAIPLIRDISKNFPNINDEILADFIAIAESTPGSIAVNLATFIGTDTAGLLGAIVATFAEILPAYIVILLFAIYFKNLLENNYVKNAFTIIRPCILGIIFSVGIYMLYENLYISNIFLNINNFINIYRSIIIFLCIILIMFLYKKFKKKPLNAFIIIILGAIFGMVFNKII